MDQVTILPAVGDQDTILNTNPLFTEILRRK